LKRAPISSYRAAEASAGIFARTPSSGKDRL
jgi:hypothetical protein